MKNKFTFFILLISFISYCQSNSEQRDPVNQNDYESMLKWNNSSIRISRYKSATINENKLIFKTETEICNETKGISLTLSSGEVLNFENAKVTCSKLETNKYNLTGSFILTPELYTKLSQTEIAEFKLGKVKVPVDFKEKGENLQQLFKFSENH